MWWHTRRKPDFVFRRNGRVHLNRRGRQFSRLLAAEVCASAAVMLDTPSSEVVWRVLAIHSIHQFPPSLPLPCVTVCHHISTGLYQCFGTTYWSHLHGSRIQKKACCPNVEFIQGRMWVVKRLSVRCQPIGLMQVDGREGSMVVSGALEINCLLKPPH